MESKRPQHKYLVWMVTILVLVAMACNMPSGGGAATPTASPTIVVDTSLLTPAYTETPDTGQPTATLPPGITPSPTVCTYNASFVTDVTIPDGETIVAGTVFDKTWRMRNNGCLPWEAGTQLIYYSGEQMGGPAAVAVPATALGGTVDITVQFTAPTDPGEHKGYWQLKAPDSTLFGPNIWVRIEVVAPTETPSPTDTPTPTEPPDSHSITLTSLSPVSPSGRKFDEDITVKFNYSTTEPGGVLIFARPITGGSLTPNYAASGSPTYSTGDGSGTATFTIKSGAVTVDQIRFQMYNTDQSELLHESFVSVNFRFTDHPIYGIGLNPASPTQLAFDEKVTIAFNYSTIQAGGVLIFVRPFTGGALTPNYAASGSPTYPTGSGSGSSNFTIKSGAVTVDRIRFQIMTTDQSTVLDEWFIAVSYKFSN